MREWLLDTNVVSELRKADPDPHVKAWSDAQAPSTLYLSTVTLAEIRYGVERHWRKFEAIEWRSQHRISKSQVRTVPHLIDATKCRTPLQEVFICFNWRLPP